MGVHINMEMPKEGSCIQIVIDDDGKVYPSVDRCIMQIGSYATAIPVPPHGRLIDADAVYKRLQKQAMSVWGDGNPRYQIILDVMDAIRFAPTIIPADEEGQK